MDENEWLTSEDPETMFAQMQDRIPWRKQRLLACACVRLVWHHVGDARLRALVELSEGYADGRTSVQSLAVAAAPLFEVIRVPFERLLIEPSLAASAAAFVVGQQSISMHMSQVLQLTQTSAVPFIERGGSEGPMQPDNDAQQAHTRHIADLFRDIIGNPFRPVALHSDWLAWEGGTVGRLAETIYEERRYQDLPVLADALEEAGCDEPEILDHLRGRGVHARGCWILDLARGVSDPVRAGAPADSGET
jgi:hypothetical protein